MRSVSNDALQDTFDRGSGHVPLSFCIRVLHAIGKEREEVLSDKEQQLLSALEPRAARENVEIVTVEIVGARKAPTIRVYIDVEGGVSFDELSSAQAWINEIIDAIDPFPGAYMLEVSSPGIDRPLRTLEHFSRFAGETCVLNTVSAINGRSKFTGTIVSAEDDIITLQLDDDTVSIPIYNVKKAHLKGTFEFN